MSSAQRLAVIPLLDTPQVVTPDNGLTILLVVTISESHRVTDLLTWVLVCSVSAIPGGHTMTQGSSGSCREYFEAPQPQAAPAQGARKHQLQMTHHDDDTTGTLWQDPRPGRLKLGWLCMY